ncbi:MAG: HAD-IIIA family hydrolase [Rhodospirillales bacterium]
MPSALHLTDDGNWLEMRRSPTGGAARPALFLDRDGLVIEEIPFLSDPAKAELIAGAASTIAAANRAGWPVVIVTNQSGVGRGVFTGEQFAAVQAAVAAELERQGAALDLVLACFYHPTEGKGRYCASHSWRKPAPGMILEAARRLAIDLKRSWIAGDNAIDILAGRAAGLAGGLHVLTGNGAAHRDRALAAATADFRVVPVASVAELPGHIPGLGQSRA